MTPIFFNFLSKVTFKVVLMGIRSLQMYAMWVPYAILLFPRYKAKKYHYLCVRMCVCVCFKFCIRTKLMTSIYFNYLPKVTFKAVLMEIHSLEMYVMWVSYATLLFPRYKAKKYHHLRNCRLLYFVTVQYYRRIASPVPVKVRAHGKSTCNNWYK